MQLPKNGSLVRVKPEALRDRALAGREFRVTQVTPNGFTKLFDEAASRELPGWYPSTELLNFNVQQLTSDVRELRGAIAKAEGALGSSSSGADLVARDAGVAEAVRAYQREHGLSDFSTAFAQWGAENPALLAEWQLLTATWTTVGALPEDVQLTERVHSRQRTKGIDFRCALKEEITNASRDLAEKVENAIHGARGDDNSGELVTAARELADVEHIDFSSAVRRLSTEPISLARTAASERQAGSFKRIRR